MSHYINLHYITRLPGHYSDGLLLTLTHRQFHLVRKNDFEHFLSVGLTFTQETFTCLTHFMPLISFDTPWKHQKTRGFSDVFREYQKRSVSWNGLKSKIEKWKKVWNILKANNKNIRTRSLTSFWCLYCNFEYISHFFNSFYC